MELLHFDCNGFLTKTKQNTLCPQEIVILDCSLLHISKKYCRNIFSFHNIPFQNLSNVSSAVVSRMFCRLLQDKVYNLSPVSAARGAEVDGGAVI